MNCSYCRSWNSDEEHRCRRCGRRLSGTLSDTSSDAMRLNRVNGNLAAAPARQVLAAPAEQLPAAEPARRRTGIQESLFPHRPASKVIPFEKFSPARVEAPASKPRGVEGPVKAEAAPKTEARPATRRPVAARSSESQPALDFLPAAPMTPRTLKTTVEAVIYCDAPVATPIHRTLAFSVDVSMVLVGFGLFLLAFYLGGGEFVLNRVTLGVFGAALMLITLFYGFVWLLACSETFGMHATQLRLTNFDGFPPERSQRLVRFAGTCLSFCSAGLGLLWALADEESLTWQDHMSNTFPTFRTPETNFVRKR